MSNSANLTNHIPPCTVLPPYIHVVDVRERDFWGPQAFVAPSAKVCVVVQPTPLTSRWDELLTDWMANENYTLYSRTIGNTLVHISRDGGVWMIEANHPVTGHPPQVLGIGCGLAFVLNPLFAVELVKLCAPALIDPYDRFEWISYS
jgi:hypothetical protein